MITQIDVSSPSNETLYSDNSIGSSVNQIKSSQTRVYWLSCNNIANSASTFIRLWNQASGNVTNGTTAPDFVVMVPGSSLVTINFSTAAQPGLNFSVALSVSAVREAGQVGATSPASAVTVTVSYQ